MFLFIAFHLVLLFPSSLAFGPATTFHSSRSFTLFAGMADGSVENCLLNGVVAMGQVMTPEFFESRPSLQTLHSQLVKNVRVRESSIPGAGLGLFAQKNLKSGTLVGFYPAHALGVDGESTLFSCSPPDRDHFQSHPSASSGYLHCTDQPLFQRPSLLGGNDTTPLYLDVNPTRPVVPGWVSHYINDGAVVTANTHEGILDYYSTTGRRRNCIHIPFGPSPVLATVTTKKVKKGEELWTSYGGTYWLGVHWNLHDEGGGGGGVPITPDIQSKIQESAMDLRKSMQAASLVYAKQAEEMTAEFHKLHRAVVLSK